MSEYLVECYLPPLAASRVSPSPAEVARAADQLTSEGRNVRLVQTTFVPEDETCFYLFDAQSRETVLEAAQRCGLQFERLVEAESQWTRIPRHAQSSQSKEKR